MTASALMSAGAEGLPNKAVPEMCDYSLQSVRSRPAKVGEKLTTHDFGTGTRGFAVAGVERTCSGDATSAFDPKRT